MAVFLPLASPACLILVRQPDVASPSTSEIGQITGRLKVHLVDGSTVVFPKGLTVDSAVLRGAGVRYGLTLGDSTRVAAVPTDSVVAITRFTTGLNANKTLLFSAVTSGALLGVGAATYSSININLGGGGW